MKRGIPVAVAVLLVAALGVSVRLFLIGEPVDGRQLAVDLADHGQTLELRASAVESAVALRGWKWRLEGSTLYGNARRVLVSPFFHDGSYETTIGIDPLDKIILGGQTVWQREPSG